MVKVNRSLSFFKLQKISINDAESFQIQIFSLFLTSVLKAKKLYKIINSVLFSINCSMHPCHYDIISKYTLYILNGLKKTILKENATLAFLNETLDT